MQSAEVRHEASCYVGGLDEKVTEAILWELFIQAGPVISVFLPKDRLTDVHQGFSFVEMQTEEDADYAIKILNMIKLFNKPIRVNKASAHQKDIDVGANIFVGNLDPSVDEKTLYDIFSAFGVILSPPRIMKDPTTDVSKGYAFINFATFESSDAAIEAMNGQFLENKPIYIQYAFKKESKGERHGSIAERLLASKNPYIGTASNQPNQFYTENPLQMPDAANSQVMVGQPIDQAQQAQFQQNMAIPVLQGQQLMMPFFNPQFLPPPPTMNSFPGTAGTEVLAPPPFMPPVPMMMPQIPLPNFPMASSDLPPAPDTINMQVHELPKPPMLDDSLQNTGQ